MADPKRWLFDVGGGDGSVLATILISGETDPDEKRIFGHVTVIDPFPSSFNEPSDKPLQYKPYETTLAQFLEERGYHTSYEKPLPVSSALILIWPEPDNYESERRTSAKKDEKKDEKNDEKNDEKKDEKNEPYDMDAIRRLNPEWLLVLTGCYLDKCSKTGPNCTAFSMAGSTKLNNFLNPLLLDDESEEKRKAQVKDSQYHYQTEKRLWTVDARK